MLFIGSGRAQLISREGKEQWSGATAPGVLPLPRGVKLPSSYPLALDWITSVERVDLVTHTKSSVEHLGKNELRIAGDGSPLIQRAEGTSDRGGAPVAAPQLFHFVRNSGGSRAELVRRERELATRAASDQLQQTVKDYARTFATDCYLGPLHRRQGRTRYRGARRTA